MTLYTSPSRLAKLQPNAQWTYDLVYGVEARNVLDMRAAADRTAGGLLSCTNGWAGCRDHDPGVNTTN